MSATSTLFDLTNRVAILTGATGRLGREVAFALADMGANLVLVARTAERLKALAHELPKQPGQRVQFVAGNAVDTDTMTRTFAQARQEFGRVDILVNGVTGNTHHTVQDMPVADWDSTWTGTTTVPFLWSRAAAQFMSEQGSGSILNIGSIYGMVAADQRIYGDSGLNSSVAYAAGKGALLQLTRYLAAYWAEQGIRVNMISPGGVEDAGNAHPDFRTNYEGRVPMSRMMRRTEIRGAVAFLASDASSYVTGHNLVVDGGFTIV